MSRFFRSALTALAIGVAAHPAARAQGLADLERAASAQAVGVRIAREDAQLQQYRLDAADAQRGPRLQGGVGWADAREPVTDTAARDYRRSSAQIGARWPLLGGAQAQARALTDARGGAEAARLRARQAETDAVSQLRAAYVDQLRSAERLALADALLQTEPAVEPLLAARTRGALLLEADRREYQSIFEDARRDAARDRAQRDDALRRVRRLTGLPQADLSREPPRWNLGCVAPAMLLARADERPAVAQAAIELSTRQALAAQQQWTGVDAGVSVTQSLSRDAGGLSGRSTGISVDLSVPFDWHALRDARRAEADSAVRRARLELDAAREADADAADAALRDLRVREAEREAALQRLGAAQEALRVAEARARRLDGDVLEKLLLARRGLYVAARDASEALQRVERAQVVVLAYAGSPCDATAVALEPAQWQTLPAALGRAVALAAPAAPAPEAVPLGWFAWQAAPWLADPDAALAALPRGSARVLLGVDAAQLRALATPAGAQALRDLVSRAHARGVRIELLLGDPGWLSRSGRTRLLRALRAIAALPFDGLNLDLERSQLPPRARRHWADGVVATVAAVHRAVAWPIGLTTHDRDLLDPATNRRLAAAGVNGLVALVYVADPERAAQRVRAVLRAAPGLRVGVGQSVERELAAVSSLHSLGRAAALARVAELARTLAARPADDGQASRFDGVVVQSFEEFRSAAP
jgi:outer membrane protein TolC